MGKSPASPLFTQPFIRAQIKENIKAPRHWPLCGEFTAQMASNAENISIWWRHHGFQWLTLMEHAVANCWACEPVRLLPVNDQVVGRTFYFILSDLISSYFIYRFLTVKNRSPNAYKFKKLTHIVPFAVTKFDLKLFTG